MKVPSGSVTRSVPLVVFVAAVGTLAATVPLSSSLDKNDKPTITIKASPPVAFAPKRVVLTVELKGGPDDYQDFYCATVEWDINTLSGGGDGAKAQQRLECDPYEPGKSEIKRIYIRDQMFRTAGDYRIQFNLKQKNKVVGSARTTIKIRPGAGDVMRDIR